jgi:hypothetical protein
VNDHVKLVRSKAGFGWRIDIGKRVSWSSTRATTQMWPRVRFGGDENCNRSITFVLWPLGHLDVWWEPRWRTDTDGMCDKCRAAFESFVDAFTVGPDGYYGYDEPRFYEDRAAIFIGDVDD